MLAILTFAALAAAPAAQQPPPSEAPPPASLDRIRKALAKPAPTLDMRSAAQRPAATFRVSVEEYSFPMATFEEQLRKDLEPTLLQRQSRDWASRCCGLDLGVIFKPIEDALDRRRLRKVRERIGRELEELERARQR